MADHLMDPVNDFYESHDRDYREALVRHEQMCRERERSLLHLLEQAVLDGGSGQVVAVIDGLPEEDRELIVERFPDLLSRLMATANRTPAGSGVDLGAAFRAIELIRQAKQEIEAPPPSDPLGVSISLPDLVALASKGRLTSARGLIAARDRAEAEKRGIWALFSLVVRRQAWFWWMRLKKGAGAC
ncbi:hypothetical protein [Microvirga sp. VF16]|uniref:hypothetical protein n=1 Tax=Microvirga sp. VF16 TaxID=2807101 RepID=UPI00193D65FA|nr:hypothetical protein [Microvirga sp. VF16]QRM35057.1 hypothetical protein JO965_39335 [Microvirga sp. VF16]